MIDPLWLLLGLFLPTAASFTCIWLLASSANTPALAGILKPLKILKCLGAATLISALSLTGLPPWQPIQGEHWIVMVVLPTAVVIALIGSVEQIPTIVRWLLRLIVACGIGPLLTRSLIPYTWSQSTAVYWWIAFALAILIVWIAMHILARKGFGRLAVFALDLSCGFAGAITIMSGYLTGGQFAAGFALVIAGAWLGLCLNQSDKQTSLILIDFIIPLSFAWLIYNWQFGWTMQNDMSPYIVAGLLVLTPLAVWVVYLPFIKSRSGKVRLAISVILCGLMLAGATSLAGYEAWQRTQSQSDYYYDY